MKADKSRVCIVEKTRREIEFMNFLKETKRHKSRIENQEKVIEELMQKQAEGVEWVYE